MNTSPPVDITTLTRDQWAIFSAGYASGHARGIERGRDLEQRRAQQVHTAAGRIVAGLSRRDARPGTEWALTESSDELTQRAIDREQAKIREIRDDNARHRATQHHQAAS